MWYALTENFQSKITVFQNVSYFYYTIIICKGGDNLKIISLLYLSSYRRMRNTRILKYFESFTFTLKVWNMNSKGRYETCLPTFVNKWKVVHFGRGYFKYVCICIILSNSYWKIVQSYYSTLCVPKQSWNAEALDAAIRIKSSFTR